MMESETEAATLDLVGEELCLNFTNTVGDHKSAEPSEHIGTYNALVAWSKHAGIVTDAVADRLLLSASRQRR